MGKGSSSATIMEEISARASGGKAISISDIGTGLVLKQRDKVPVSSQKPFILSGYRQADSPVSCVFSMLVLHNETFNIATSLLSAVVIAVICVQTPPSVALWLFASTCMASHLLSAAAHTFCCLPSVETVMWDIDLLGIFISGLGKALAISVYTFRDRRMWLAFVSCMVMATVGGVFLGTRMKASQRGIVVAITCLSACAMLVASCMTNSCDLSTPMFSLLHFLLRIALGFIVYSLRIPERWAPGSFDIYCSSHQIWHMCALAADLAGYDALMLFQETPCTVAVFL